MLCVDYMSILKKEKIKKKINGTVQAIKQARDLGSKKIKPRRTISAFDSLLHLKRRQVPKK